VSRAHFGLGRGKFSESAKCRAKINPLHIGGGKESHCRLVTAAVVPVHFRIRFH
jgi:hypothetical protein